MNNAIYEYYQAIKDGSVTVGKWVMAAYGMIIKGLENKTFFYSHKKAAAAVMFIENFCRHHEGALAPQLIKLELWQKAFISALFGILDKYGNRQFRECFMCVGRKNGKTLIAAAIATYCAFLDGEYGGRIYFAAPKLEQANLCFDAFVQMVQKDPELNAMAKKRRTDIYISDTNTSAKPLAFNAKKSDGLNVSLAIADECASWQGDAGLKFYEVIKSSFGARKQPLLLNITTSGYVNDGIYDELMKRSTRVLLGEGQETRLLPLIYTIDDVGKWNDINELRKSNPNLGVSITVDYLLEEIAIAEGSLSKKAEFITKYTCTKQNSSQAWFEAQDVEKCFGAPLDFETFKGHYCVVGIDLSQTTDLTCCLFVVEKEGKLNVLAKFFMPEGKIDEATARDGLPYRIYVQRGLLQPSGENFVDYEDCKRWITETVNKYRLYPRRVGYDRYSAQYLVNDLKSFGLVCDDVFQGENLTPIINEVDGLMRDHRFNFGDNDLMKVHLLNAALKQNNETNRRRLIKTGQTARIDGTAALLDAICMRQKWAAEDSYFLKNEGK